MNTVVSALRSECPCPVLGSKVSWCNRCNRAVMLSPDSQEVMRSAQAHGVLCMGCFANETTIELPPDQVGVLKMPPA